MAQPAAPSDTEEEEEDTRGPAPGGETGPWTMGAGAALQPALLRGVWHHFPARFGSGSKQPGVQENIPGWVEKGGGECNVLFPSPLSLPGKSVWIMHRAEPPVRRVWALGDPEGTGTCCSAGSPVVAASRGGTGLSLCPRSHPAARWQVGNGAASPGTAQPLLHPPVTSLPKSRFRDAVAAPEASPMFFPPAAGFPPLSQGSFPSRPRPRPVEPKELDPD